jgi:Glycerophosphoryl diester phosphodiesterase family
MLMQVVRCLVLPKPKVAVRFKRSIFLPAVTLFVAMAAVAQTSNCPNNSPTNRPAGAVPSQWNLKALLQYMVSPASDLVPVVSHRGNWEYCPENTLEAFQSAWDLTAEAAEMDVRVSAPGMDPYTGVNYPNGEVFLSHDFDMRGEAPNTLNQPTNFIYSLTPDQLVARNMADRHGDILKDSLGNYLHLPTFTQNLQSLYDRAKTVNGIAQGKSTIVVGGKPWDLMTNGMLLVVDVKGTIDKTSRIGVDQYDTFIECMKELNAFQSANHVDMRYAIAYKVGFTNIYGSIVKKSGPVSSVAQYMVGQLMNQSTMGYVPGEALPGLIFIIFPVDACVPNSNPCQQLQPSDYTQLNDFRNNYAFSPGDIASNAFLVGDWQYRNEGDSLAMYFTDQLWKGRGVAMFLASNNFSDGVRNSGGNCANTFHDTNQPPINTSICLSDPIQRWSSSSFDYLVPAFGPAHATAITTDQYQNAMDYLTAIGKNNKKLIQ